MRKFNLVILASLYILVSTSISAQANLVSNGDFETLGAPNVNWVSNFPSWSVTDVSNATGIYTGQYLGLGTHSGVGFLWGGAYNGFYGSISQTLVTTPGQNYNLDFWLANTNGGLAANNYWSVQWNNTILYTASNVSDFAYTEKYEVVTGTGSDTLTFVFNNEPGAFGLDDISVERTTTAAVPIPPTILLLCSGIAGVALYRKKYNPYAG